MLKTVQAGRGLAALAVCAFHLSIGLGDARYLGYRVFDTYTWRGNLGVDFFFVLSGFIIMFAHNKDINQPGKWKQYITKRFVRVFPIYWLYTIGYSVLVLAGFSQVATVPDTVVQWISTFSLIRLENFATPLGPAWTLFHEIGFYIVFSVLIFSRKWGVALIAAWMATILYFFHFNTVAERSAFSTYFSAYNLDFLIGIAAYFLWKRAKLIEGYFVLAVGILLLVATLIVESQGLVFEGYRFLYGLAFGGILAGMVIWESTKTNIYLPLATLIGNASYTIYLTHEPVQGVLMKAFMKLNTHLGLSSAFLYCIILVLNVAVCCAVYKIVEVPVIEFCKRKFLKRA